MLRKLGPESEKKKKKHNLLSSPLIIRDKYMGLFNVVLCSHMDVSKKYTDNLSVHWLIFPNRRTKKDAKKRFGGWTTYYRNICSSNFIISLRTGGKIQKYLKPPPSENGSLGPKKHRHLDVVWPPQNALEPGHKMIVRHKRWLLLLTMAIVFSLVS